jgi:acetyl/propionyl-CoA carboxylase alpha subunit
MYTVKSGKKTTTVNLENEGGVQIGDTIIKADVLPLGEGHYHFLLDNKSYNVELISIEKESKTVQLKVNGVVFAMELKDKFDELLQKMGLGAGVKAKIAELKAPMPGLVIEIRVEIGQQILKGDPVLLLEAMKMENIIKSPVDAVIKKIVYKKGDAVEKGAVLVVFE